MPIDFVPSRAIGWALAGCALLPCLVLALSHGPLRIAAPGKRFVSAAILSWLSWATVMAMLAPAWLELLSGALLLATATLAGFTLWTLIAWGFTLSLLQALDRGVRSLTVEEWALVYTRGRPFDVFARDRLGVLFMLGLAEPRGGNIVMTANRGWFLARLAGWFRRLFGLSQ